MSDDMSLEDWQARAALVGMHYARLGHYFYRLRQDGISNRYDPETMEPLTLEQTLGRPTWFNSLGWSITQRVIPVDEWELFRQERWK